MERADPKEKSTEQIATGKTEAPGPEASDKSIDYIICMLRERYYLQNKY
jgi:hypothetical protein